MADDSNGVPHTEKAHIVGFNNERTSLPRPNFLGVPSNSAKHQLDRQVKDLSRTLKFTDEACTSSYPCVPRYSSARHNFWKLFQPGNLGQSKKDTSSGGGRYKIRSSIKHLPCHLEDSISIKIARVCNPKKETFSMEDASVCHSLDKLDPFSGTGNYVRDLKAGARPVHPSGRGSVISLDNDTKYQKILQKNYPQPPESYFMEGDKSRSGRREGIKFRRWLDLPQLVKTPEQMIWQERSPQDFHSETYSRSSQETITSTCKSSEGQEFFEIIRMWASHRRLHVQLKDVKCAADLVKNMHSLSNSERMLAVVSAALLAEDQEAERHRMLRRSDHWSRQYNRLLREGNKVTEELVQCLEKLLDDAVARVRVPSAIILYAINRHTAKVESVLFSALTEGSGGADERWAAVQCLVCAGQHSAAIIAHLLHHLLDAYQPSKQAKAEELLARISHKTTLVHTMIADLLNNSGWRERFVACKTLSKLLHTDINKDMCGKLLACAWEDWRPSVRQVAAQTLGQTSHGKLVHNEIASRLIHASDMVRLDAIRKLHSLNLMTSKLFPGYMACFQDHHVSIQAEAIALACTLGLQHPAVLMAIKQLLQDSYCWTIKVCALRALAHIGACDEQLVEQLMWVVRFEKVPSVRSEACKTIAKLGLDEERVLKCLRDLVTVDDDPAVVKQAQGTLVELGHSATVCDDMLQSVCSKVKCLGTKEAITDAVRREEVAKSTNYVIASRPTQQLSARDYLNHKSRRENFP